MSGVKDSGGERTRCPIHGHNRRLSRREINEIRRGVEIANSRAKRAGKKPKPPRITRFSCACNCFSVDVE